jgi:predicted SAM-dependent methyltransferase
MFSDRLRSSLRRRCPRGLARALHLLENEFKLTRLHRSGRKRAYAYYGVTGLKLNIGCGPIHKDDYINIDLLEDADLSLDMRKEIPLASGSCTAIYSEHFLEHLDYPDDAKRFLAECYRLLEPSGLISIGVPDTRWPLEEYAGLGNGEYFESAEKTWHPSWCKTPLEHVNFHFRQYSEHRFAYDLETLTEALVEAGFTNVSRRPFDPSLDSENRRIGTLYVNGQKPVANANAGNNPVAFFESLGLCSSRANYYLVARLGAQRRRRFKSYQTFEIATLILRLSPRY